MAFAPSASWNSRSITHLANYPSPSLPMISSDESKILTDGFFELQGIGGYRRGPRFDEAQLLIGIADAVNHGDGAQHSNDPEHRSHTVKQRADYHQHDALRTLHESGLAALHQRLGARASVANHHRTDHDERHHHHVKEAIGACVIHQQPKEERHIAVAVNHRIEEPAKLRHLVGGAGDAAIDHVENAGANDHQPGVHEHPPLVLSVGIAEQ